MGLITSRFRDEEPADILVRLEANIKNIERDSRRKRQTHMRISKCWLMLFIMIYIVAFIVYMETAPRLTWTEGLVCAMLLVIMVPVLFIILRAAIFTYYSRALAYNRVKIDEQREQKKKILTEFKNTAEVAKGILSKYSDVDQEAEPLI